MTIPFGSFQRLAQVSGNRPLVLWGAGNICAKTLRKIDGRAVVRICDNSANLRGGEQEGIEIIAPNSLDTLCPEAYVLICTTSFREVTLQLTEMGLVAEQDFMVSPILNDQRVIDDMESLETRLLLSSGTQPSFDPGGGGGLYEMTVKGTEWNCKKVFSGSCHSILQKNDRLFTVDDELGLLEMDTDYSVVRHQPLPVQSRGHGLAYDEEEDCFYIACSGLDAVLVYDVNFTRRHTIPLSVKQGRKGGPFHHTNDCCINGDSLYVSMFSETGNWKRDVFDGAVVEFDIRSGERVGTPIRDLWMPHSISTFNGGLVVLDSLRGTLRGNNASVIGQFPAFARGLAYNGHLYFIGQSRNRNFSKNIGLSKNISIDTGVVVFDETTKVSRLLQLSPKISEIHAVSILA